MKQRIRGGLGIGAALLMSSSPAALAGDLASIETHSQRYGDHVAISAYDDPLVKGVTCYVTESHSNGAFGGGRMARTADLTASCHQTGNLEVAAAVPAQATVFTAQRSPIFGSLHVFRVVDVERHALVYFTYSEDETAGDLPGHLYVIRLPANLKMPTR
ncbi:CreA family protein (plasmid) [Paraburkholderia strydomiana]